MEIFKDIGNKLKRAFSGSKDPRGLREGDYTMTAVLAEDPLSEIAPLEESPYILLSRRITKAGKNIENPDQLIAEGLEAEIRRIKGEIERLKDELGEQSE